MTRKKRCVLSSHYLRLVVRKIGPRAVLLSWTQIRNCSLDCSGMPRCDGTRHLFWRLAHCEDNGFAHNATPSSYWRFLRRVRSCNDNWTRYFRARSHFNYSRNRWKRCGRGSDTRRTFGSLAVGQSNNLGLDTNFSGRRHYRGCLLLPHKLCHWPLYSCSYSSSVVGR
jgi:hypothetical protein